MSNDHQNQHYLNKALVKRFSQDKININILHIYKAFHLEDDIQGNITCTYKIIKNSEIKYANINSSAFCSRDGFSSGKNFWDADLEKILNNSIENNLFNLLFNETSSTQINKKKIFDQIQLFSVLGIEVDLLNLKPKLLSRLFAFIHINHQLSHYESLLTKNEIIDYIDNMNSIIRYEILKQFKVFHIKLDPKNVIGRIILNEFSSGYNLSKVFNTSDTDFNPFPYTDCHLLTGEFDLILIAKFFHDVPQFIFSHLPIINNKINLEYYNSCELNKQIRKSIVIGSSSTDSINNLIDLFNSKSFKDYINIPQAKKNDYVYFNNKLNKDLFDEFNVCYNYAKFQIKY